MKQFEISNSVRKELSNYLEYAQSKPQSRHGQRNNQWRSRGHRSCRITGDDSENLFFGKNENLFLDEKRFDDGIYQYALGCR